MITIDRNWTGNAIHVDAFVHDDTDPIKDARDTPKAVHWTLVLRNGPAPTDMQVDANSRTKAGNWIPLAAAQQPAVFDYDMLPANDAQGEPLSYANQSILEQFTPPKAIGFTKLDLKPGWAANHPGVNIDNPDAIAAAIFSEHGHSSLTVDAQNQLHDQNTFGDPFEFVSAFLSTSLLRGIGYSIDQTYSAANAAIKTYTISRRIIGVTVNNATKYQLQIMHS